MFLSFLLLLQLPSPQQHFILPKSSVPVIIIVISFSKTPRTNFNHDQTAGQNALFKRLNLRFPVSLQRYQYQPRNIPLLRSEPQLQQSLLLTSIQQSNKAESSFNTPRSKLQGAPPKVLKGQLQPCLPTPLGTRNDKCFLKLIPP